MPEDKRKLRQVGRTTTLNSKPQCPAKNTKCGICNKIGHFTRFCGAACQTRQKKVGVFAVEAILKKEESVVHGNAKMLGLPGKKMGSGQGQRVLYKGAVERNGKPMES